MGTPFQFKDVGMPSQPKGKAGVSTRSETSKKASGPLRGVKSGKVAKAGSKQSGKALKTLKALSVGAHSKSARRVFTKPRFRRPSTYKAPRCPKDRRFLITKRNKFDAFKIIQHPYTTEAAVKKIEDNNTLVFIVDRRASKPAIKAAVQQLYSVKVAKVNTLNTPTNTKKAFVKLPPEIDALDIANRIGVLH